MLRNLGIIHSCIKFRFIGILKRIANIRMIAHPSYAVKLKAFSQNSYRNIAFSAPRDITFTHAICKQNTSTTPYSTI